MDYSRFVDAVLTDDTAQINEMVPVITAVLIKFLKVRLHANHQDAEDCCQSTLMLATQKIRQEQIKNPDSFIYYLFTTAKNEYLKLLKQMKEGTYEEVPDSHTQPPDQLINLLDKERQSILKICMGLLKPEFLEYIRYWFDHPRDEATVVASHFGISVNNAWTKKHRIVKTLKECVEKKLSK
jgi:DNA-directed RNA polymerase specialized sigma24 family protein